MYNNLFFHPIFDGHLSGFLFGTLMNNADMNILFMFFALYVPDFLLIRVHRECICSTVLDTAYIHFLGLL